MDMHEKIPDGEMGERDDSYEISTPHSEEIERGDPYEIPIPRLEEIVPEIGKVVPNPEVGNSGDVISRIERKENEDKEREKEVNKIIEKRDRKIH